MSEVVSSNSHHGSSTSTTNGMSVSNPVPVVVKQVDSKNLVGTNAGTDTRVKAADAVLPPNPPVRASSNGDPDAKLEGVGG
jgi:hypothetical protein